MVDGIEKVSGANSANKAEAIQPRKYEATPSEWNKVKKSYSFDEQAYKEVLARVNYVKDNIAEIELRLKSEKLTDAKRAELQKVLNEYKAIYQEQQEMADVKVSQDGKTVTITPKKDIPVEILKDKFFIEDGAFREILKKEYQQGNDNGVFVEKYSRALLPDGTRFNYTRAILFTGETYEVSGTVFKSQH